MLQFNSTLGYPGEGPSPLQCIHVGTANITSWGSLVNEFDDDSSDVKKGQVWAIQEHKLFAPHERGVAENFLKGHGFKAFLPPCSKGKGGGNSGGWDGFFMNGYQC